ncbi:hypothetical protein ASG76_13405 [Nocardioides sp. Soil774]|uniref:hypothetical protein n=1 Tax=Nocardioides sp. Soil774 TaxID=1736408 RepID=UPI000700F8CC|nr:hypothetical protein [Nocardioides sp. Soil774]KRE93453.1 hypothetical protein ASG76_13405 [Nocardioides sp. Soil774]
MLEVIIMLADDPTPKENDVVAGPLGFALWIFMILAVVVLGFSLVKQLRKAQAAKDAGLYGDEPVESSETTGTTDTTDPAGRTDTER